MASSRCGEHRAVAGRRFAGCSRRVDALGVLEVLRLVDRHPQVASQIASFDQPARMRNRSELRRTTASRVRSDEPRSSPPRLRRGRRSRSSFDVDPSGNDRRSPRCRRRAPTRVDDRSIRRRSISDSRRSSRTTSCGRARPPRDRRDGARRRGLAPETVDGGGRAQRADGIVARRRCSWPRRARGGRSLRDAVQLDVAASADAESAAAPCAAGAARRRVPARWREVGGRTSRIMLVFTLLIRSGRSARRALLLVALGDRARRSRAGGAGRRPSGHHRDQLRLRQRTRRGRQRELAARGCVAAALPAR